MNRWLTAAGSALLVLHPNYGLGVLALATLVGRSLPIDRMGWGLALGIPLLIPVPFQFLAGQSVSWLVVQALAVMLLCVISAGTRKYVGLGLLVGLLSLVVLGLVTADSRASTFVGQNPNPIAQFRGISELGPRSMYWSVAKEWRTEGSVDAVELVFDVRTVEGVPGRDWYRYDPRISITSCDGFVGSSCSQVNVPTSVDTADGTLMISRELDTGTPLAGRKLRLSAELRSDIEQTTSGCDGISLQDGAGRYRTECLPIALSPEWSPYIVDWTVPPDIDDTELRAVISNVTGQFEVANVLVEEWSNGGWQRLGPLEPTGLQVGVRSPGVGRRDVPAHTVLPTTEWERHRVQLDTAGHVVDGVLRVNFLIEGMLGLEIRHLKAYPLGGVEAFDAVSESRWELGYGQPNYLGHSAVLMGAGVALLGSSFLVRSGGILAASVLVLGSGSRAALLALVLVAVLLLVLVRNRWVGGAFLCLIGIAGVVLLVVSPETAQRFSIFVDGNNATRSEIWSVAVNAVRDEPILGLGGEGFHDYWVDNGKGWSNTAPTHAHNFLLQLASFYGVPGLVAAGVFLVVLGRLSWVRMRWRGLILVAAVLLLNTFDFTLLLPGVLGTLLLVTAAGSKSGQNPTSL